MRSRSVCVARIATRLLAELKDEQAWQVRFEFTTDEQWDLLAAKVRQEIAAGDTTFRITLYLPSSAFICVLIKRFLAQIKIIFY